MKWLTDHMPPLAAFKALFLVPFFLGGAASIAGLFSDGHWGQTLTGLSFFIPTFLLVFGDKGLNEPDPDKRVAYFGRWIPALRLGTAALIAGWAYSFLFSLPTGLSLWAMCGYTVAGAGMLGATRLVVAAARFEAGAEAAQ